MATVVDVDSEPSCSIPKTTSLSPSLSHRFLDSKFYLLVVIGELVTEEHLRRAIANIERGIQSWDTNLIECNLDQELKLFVSRHSARFSPEIRGKFLEVFDKVLFCMFFLRAELINTLGYWIAHFHL
uniref:Microtubule-associated protein 1B/S N-terminal domain-containing protein n=1 Tax=Calidris pygmaea TaxID=425635 RepID=A0A8C3KAG0_9CHAR